VEQLARVQQQRIPRVASRPALTYDDSRRFDLQRAAQAFDSPVTLLAIG
jgi:hypothetical protein